MDARDRRLPPQRPVPERDPGGAVRPARPHPGRRAGQGAAEPPPRPPAPRARPGARPGADRRRPSSGRTRRRAPRSGSGPRTSSRRVSRRRPVAAGDREPRRSPAARRDAGDRRRPRGATTGWSRATARSRGAPIMANDPHRTIQLPSLRYWVHLVAPGWNVIGGRRAGAARRLGRAQRARGVGLHHLPDRPGRPLRLRDRPGGPVALPLPRRLGGDADRSARRSR